MSLLEEGTKLRHIQIDADCSITVGDAQHDAKTITVSMQAGHMAYVPWARVENNDGNIHLINLARVESVILEE